MKLIIAIVLTLCLIGNLHAKRVGVGGACSSNKNCVRGLRCTNNVCTDPNQETTNESVQVVEPVSTCPHYSIGQDEHIYAREATTTNTFGWNVENQCAWSNNPETGVSFTSEGAGYHLIRVASDSFVPNFWVRGGATCDGSGETQNQLDRKYMACIGADTSGAGGTAEHIIYLLQSQTIMIFVEGEGNTANVFDIQVTRVPCPFKSAGRWTTRGDFGGDSTLSYNANTVPEMCGGTQYPSELINEGRDDAFSFSPSRKGTYTLELSPQYNAFVYIKQISCTGPVIACTNIPAGETGQLSVSLNAGGVYVIIVDGAGADQAGVFQGSISRTSGKKKRKVVTSLRRLKSMQAQTKAQMLQKHN